MDYIFLMLLSAMWGKVFEFLDLRIWDKRMNISAASVCVCVSVFVSVCMCVRVCIVRGAQSEPESQDCLPAD